MHRKEWGSIKFLESWNQNDIDVFDVEHIEMADVVLGLAAIGKDFTTNRFVEYLVFG